MIFIRLRRTCQRLPLCMLLLCLCVFASCLRYTPSREEISREGGMEKDKNEYIISEEAFHQHENLQRQRLEEIVAQRHLGKDSLERTSYHIGIGDVLEINVFDVPELISKSVRVRPSGMISLPLIEPFKAAGLTEAELQEEIARRLDKFLQSPQVSVSITEYAAHKISVIGEVAKPGTYNLKRDDYSLIELLSEAGGRTQRASGYIVLIPAGITTASNTSGTLNPTGFSAAWAEKKSVTSGAGNVNLAAARPLLGENTAGKNNSQGYALSESVAGVDSIKPIANIAAAAIHGIEIPFDDLIGSAERVPLNVPLLPGDTIVIPEGGMVQVDGEVNKPGSFPIASRMTLLGAIASAGSITYSANVKNVEVIREVAPAKKAVLTVDLEQLALGGGKDVRLRDGDVVRVPSAKGRFATRQFVDIITRVVTFGVGGTL